MRNTLKTFALLDLISMALLAKPTWDILTNIDNIPNELMSQIKSLVIPIIFLSLLVSAAGLWFYKYYGFITYYIQFPFRLIFWVFSIGFITYIPEYFNLSEGWFNAMFKICFVAEFFRIYYTILAHRRY